MGVFRESTGVRENVELPVDDDRKSHKQNKRKRKFRTSGLIATG
jgi:hypothetical protein